MRMRPSPLADLLVLQDHRVFGRQPVRRLEERHQAQRAPAGALAHRLHAVVEQGGIAAEAIDDEAHDHVGVGGIDHRLGADQACDHAAAVDVAHQHDGHVGRARKTHVGDVVGAQIDLGRRARAFDQHEIAFAREASEAVEHRAQELGLQSLIFARLGVAHHLALHHDLRADIALGLQQHRVHVDAERNAGGTRLQRLGAADLAAVGGDRGVVRHVLRLERADTKTTARKSARQPATSNDLPTSDPVPWIMMARAVIRTRCPPAPSRRRRSGASPGSSRSPGRPPRSARAWRCGR